MRDDSLDAPIPEKFTPHDFEEKEITKAKAEVRRFETMTLAEAESTAVDEFWKAHREYEASIAKRTAHRARLEAMLAQVEAWTPPTPDHTELRKFMRDQITETIRFDCDYEAPAPKRLTGVEYLKDRRASAKQRLEWAEDSHAKELARTDERNAWVDALRKSLEPTT